ncbi:formate-dependent phosphoribosylglycinamide formyltransferase [Kordiimonas sp. SCSIO 12610]|uniref:formate-dependent phosphoribosylglycinamide formyltransferase n=1 Tax=Kordiimonas sp. SCSIO 12610 TaxID=2829597 RepID=UPI00210A948D|nr:formate-dependent phosphoribosylglycinamide formyltransferase [Kordiimonas sp. SCSIO 12610]UTW55278.1 formate-dependent phosphoribosylglycinamide formyltransferase [Kordiimonas sp. SCSIO 12610]
MKIGTPLSESATRVMLLGAGELGKEVIIALQRYGVEVIAVDRYENAPGHQVAHKAVVVDMTDPKALRSVIEKYSPHYIVPEIEAIATDVLAVVDDEGVSTVIPTAKAVQLTMNREGIRTLAAEELGLPTSPYAFASSLDEVREAITGDIGFPCLIKPVMSSSGKGQSLLKSETDIDGAWSYAQEGGRVSGSRVIIEGFVDFDYEITLLTVRSIGKGGEVETSFCNPIGHRQESGDYVESWQPMAMSEQALANAQLIAEKVTTALGGQGIFGVELFVKDDDVWFSEVSPRPHDTGLVTLITQKQNEFELHARALLGLPVDTSQTLEGASAVIYGGMDGKAISYAGLADALMESDTEIRLFGKPEAFERRRMGVAVASGDDTDLARQKAALAASKIKPTLS